MRKSTAWSLIAGFGAFMLISFQNMSPLDAGLVTTRLRPVAPPPFTTKTPADFRLMVQNKGPTRTLSVHAAHLWGTGYSHNDYLGNYVLTNMATNQKSAVYYKIPGGFRPGFNKFVYSVWYGNTSIHYHEEVYYVYDLGTSVDKTVGLGQTAWIDPANILQSIKKRERNPAFTGDNRIERTLQGLIRDLRANNVTTLIISYPEFGQVRYFEPLSTFINNAWPISNACSTDGVKLISWTHDCNWCEWLSSCTASPTGYQADKPVNDFMEIIFDEADALGMSVFMGLGRDDDEALLQDLYNVKKGLPDPHFRNKTIWERLAIAKNLEYMKAQNLFMNYGQRKSFWGWYLSHEANDLESSLQWYYNDMANLARQASSPELPVMIAPAGNPSRFTTLDVATLIQASTVDIFAFQDSVGPGYIETTGTYTWDWQSRINALPAYYGGLRTKFDQANAKLTSVPHKQLWSVTELWRMDGTCVSPSDPKSSYCGDFPTPVPSQVLAQVNAAKTYVDRISYNEASGFLQTTSMPMQFTPQAGNIVGGAQAGTCGLPSPQNGRTVRCTNFRDHARGLWDYLRVYVQKRAALAP